VAGLLLASGIDAMAVPRATLPAESRITFVVQEMGVPVDGRFEHFDSTIDIDPTDPVRSSALLRIDLLSIATGAEEVDAVAVDKDWLDAAHTRFATFRSSSCRALGAGRFEATGQLTLRNRSRELVVQFTSAEQGAGRTLISGDFVLRRSDFGIGGGHWNAPGLVGQEIPVKVRLMLAAPLPAAR
jgi:polyisoprenoid-binding protein YceI